MENFNDLLKHRRSHRKFTEEEISEDNVVTILKAALMAPTSHNSKSWKFVAVDDKDSLKQLSQCKESGSSLIANAAIAIVVCADPMASDVWIEDAAVASTVMLLQAEDLGLGACWVQIRERNTAHGTPSEDFVRNVLNIPMQLEIVSIIAIGHKLKEKSSIDENDLPWEKVYINKYENR